LHCINFNLFNMKRIVIIVIALSICLICGFNLPLINIENEYTIFADSISIKEHLTAITKTKKSRNYQNLQTLNGVGQYIYDEFQKYADTTYYQKYDVNGNEYKNVIAVFGSRHTKTIVIGAHYDVCGEQEGADDNASGVVGLLELGKMFKGQKLNYRLEIVAYTLEEPPFFRTDKMGSYIHAQSLKERNIDVYGMLCLEMIGYFDKTENSQNYPLGILSWVYGDKGDYITLVNKFNNGKFAGKFSKLFKSKKSIKTKGFTAPKSMPGIDFSDHLNYWNAGYSALMITDTSFYRNHNYHEKTDTMETLDIPKIAKVVDTVFQSVCEME